MINYSCFEKIAMSGDSPKSESVRMYFIKIRQFLVENQKLIFQAMEDFLSMSNFDETGHYVWFSNFLQWCKSPILQNMWMVQKSNYADTTKDLVNLLIDTAKSNNIQNAADLTAIAKQLDTSYDFKKILEKRHAWKTTL